MSQKPVPKHLAVGVPKSAACLATVSAKADRLLVTPSPTPSPKTKRSVWNAWWGPISSRDSIVFYANILPRVSAAVTSMKKAFYPGMVDLGRMRPATGARTVSSRAVDRTHGKALSHSATLGRERIPFSLRRIFPREKKTTDPGAGRDEALLTNPTILGWSRREWKGLLIVFFCRIVPFLPLSSSLTPLRIVICRELFEILLISAM